ncbi:hypothetical protein EXIGLDRAFT_700740 [Exidia glandulosa HHB12029]|uniref:Uncharacterized protein n=1 Tax=Exidia glandulosa HHB12029 TaxID=1314781 RepID=A0A165ZMN3_EXIGL|nr:hypothetical protein EXIGLDRAFT_700740 [Exidia glandulosa HHB12029]
MHPNVIFKTAGCIHARPSLAYQCALPPFIPFLPAAALPVSANWFYAPYPCFTLPATPDVTVCTHAYRDVLSAVGTVVEHGQCNTPYRFSLCVFERAGVGSPTTMSVRRPVGFDGCKFRTSYGGCFLPVAIYDANTNATGGAECIYVNLRSALIGNELAEGHAKHAAAHPDESAAHIPAHLTELGLRTRTSAMVSKGLSMATVALNIAGAATDAVPVVKQILNSAAHISAAAEVDIAVAGRVLDARFQQRLARLLCVFVKIEALVEEKAVRKNSPEKIWHRFITKPNRAEGLATELDQEMTLFNLLTGIQLSLTVDHTARAVADDARYDGQFRRLRDCDVEKLDVLHKHETEAEVIVWSSARVDGQLMVVRHIEPLTLSANKNIAVALSRRQSLSVSYSEFLKNVEKVSCPEEQLAVLTATLCSFMGVTFVVQKQFSNLVKSRYLARGYKILHATAHLATVHRLRWVGHTAVVDENGEPRIGLFDDLVRADNDLPGAPYIYWNLFTWFNSRSSEQTGVVEEVHNSSLQAIVTEQLRLGNDTGRLHRVWDIIRQQQLHVGYYRNVLPILSGILTLSQESIARAWLYFKTNMEDPRWVCEVAFFRHVLAGGGAKISSRICISMWRDDGEYTIAVTYDTISLRSLSRPDAPFWQRLLGLWDYPTTLNTPGAAPITDGKGADGDSGNSDAWISSEEEDEDYETVDEGEKGGKRFDAAGEE